MTMRTRYVMLPATIALGGVLAVFLLMGWSPGQASAAPSGEWRVCKAGLPTCDFSAIQEAVDAAEPGDVIKVAQGTYSGTVVRAAPEGYEGAPPGGVLTQVVFISMTLTIQGGYTTSNWLAPDPEAHPTTLDGENTCRVVYIGGSTAPVLDGLIIRNGNAEGLGGYPASDAGGGIYADGADPVIRHCIISGNSVGAASASHQGQGGGLFLKSGDAQVEHNVIISNTARWGGGGRVISGVPVLRHNQFLSNTSLYGGGVYLMWSEGLVEGSLFEGNSADFGGGLYLSGASSRIEGNLIRHNQAGVGGGIGINNAGQSPVVVLGNRILQNKAGWVGGGVNIQHSDTRLENNFIAQNDARIGAGANLENGSPVLRHNTLAGNVAAFGSGALLVGEEAAVVLSNTILVSHTVGISVTAGSTATLEATLWYGNGSDTGGEGSIHTGAINIWGDPAFVDSAGGDFHIGSGSAAVDAGVDAGATFDIDGDRRDAAPDIGADEVVQPRIYVPLVVKER
jgi:hypothetical protein